MRRPRRQQQPQRRSAAAPPLLCAAACLLASHAPPPSAAFLLPPPAARDASRKAPGAPSPSVRPLSRPFLGAAGNIVGGVGDVGGPGAECAPRGLPLRSLRRDTDCADAPPSPSSSAEEAAARGSAICDAGFANSYAIESIVTAGLSSEEVAALMEMVVAVAADFESQDDAPHLELDLASDGAEESKPSPRVLGGPAPPAAVPGATGRAVLLGVRCVGAGTVQEGEKDAEDAATSSEDDRLDLRLALSHAWDSLLRGGFEAQPFHLEVMGQPRGQPGGAEGLLKEGKDEVLREWIGSRIAERVQGRGLRVPLPRCTYPLAEEARVAAASAVPALQYEFDRAEAMDFTGYPHPHAFADAKEVLAFDGLITDDLRGRLLDVVLGRGDGDSTEEGHEEKQVWNDARDGPDPRRWVRGGLVDNVGGDGEDQESVEQEDQVGGVGLTTEATDDLCHHPHAAILEFEAILANLCGPAVMVLRMDGAALGEEHVTPLVANAPCHGDVFEPHIDADPTRLPPSPWTDVFGRYPNRSPGKPRFVSCLVYLNDEWDCEKWGAPTRIWDVESGETVDVAPKPGRVVLMDQDVVHSVVAPTEEAGKRPRYSLVWKLILHPDGVGGDRRQVMKGAIRRDGWPEATRVGSAKSA